MRKYLLWLFLFIPSMGYAQGVPFAVNPPAPNAQITVCSAPAVGANPCTNTIAIYTTSALTTQITQPAQIGPTGNYTFFYSPQNIIVQITGRSDQFVGSGTAFNQGPAIIDPLTFGVLADGHAVKDATTTNTSPIVTCPNADCNFLTTAKVGQRVYAAQGLGGTCGNGAYIIPASTTILSIDSDTQIHATNNAAFTCTATAGLIWGDVDQNTAGTGPLQTAWNAFILALQHGPAVFKIPCGLMLVDGGVGSTTNFITPLYMPTYQGCGPASSIFAPTPNFTWTTCPTKVCFLNGVGVNAALAQNVVRDFSIFGDGVTNTNCPPSSGYFALALTNNVIANNIYVNEWCNAATNGLTGMAWGGVSLLTNIQSDFAGTTGCTFATAAQPIIVIQAFCGDANPAVTITGTGEFIDISSTYQGPQCGQGVVVTNTATLSLYGTDVAQSLNLAAGSRVYTQANATLTNINCGATGPVQFAGNATVIAQDTNITTSGTTQVLFTGTGTYADRGNNTITPGTLGVGTAGLLTYIADGHSIKGSCTGVVTASSTLGLYGTGPNVTASTCTSTNIGTGMVTQGGRTLKNLFVTSTAAGVNASSGVVTVLKNGAGTTITCTIGTGTSCADGLHTVAAVDGDLISIQFTTQAADTLAGVKAIVAWQ